MQYIITGAKGMLGTQVANLCNNPITFDSKKCDLRIQDDFSDQISVLINQGKVVPEDTVIIHCAARVGGIKANTDYISDFFTDNININLNVLNAANTMKLKKLVSILSTCIYPDVKYVSYPLTEEQLHSGPPHNSNFGYAYAKRMLEAQSRAYRQQYKSNFVTVICNNLYGTNDNYDDANGHVIPSLIRRFYEAVLNNKKEVVCWGSGKALREFTYATDAAKIIKWVVENYDDALPLNIGNTQEISIKDITELIAKEVGYNGDIIWDSSKPDGQLRKPSSNQRLIEFGYEPNYTSIEQGLKESVEWFKINYPNVRGV